MQKRKGKKISELNTFPIRKPAIASSSLLSGKGLKGTVVNQICHSINEGSLETPSTALKEIIKKYI